MSSLPTSLERLRGRVGVWTLAHESVPAADSGEIARELEALGYSALWLPEAWGREAFTSSQLMLEATTTLVVATGIASIWARDAVTAANASRTLNAAFQDRFVLGLGVSHPHLVERLRGHEYAQPLAAMDHYLTALSAAPMLAPEAEQPYATVLAALGPAMMRLGATRADGMLSYLVTPEHTRGARAACGDAFVAVEQSVVLDVDREEFLRRAHAHLNLYTGLDNYRRSWRRQGFSAEDWVRGGSERLCDALVVHGDADAVVNRVREHFDAGADHVCLQVLGPDATPPLETWRHLAPVLAAQWP